MDFIEGKTLNQFIGDETLNYETYFNILQQISFALDKCHKFDVNHNDLNFDNILIDTFGNIKLIDFFYDVIVTTCENMHIEDVKYFQKIEEKLHEKVTNEYLGQCRFIHNYIISMRNFNNIKQAFISIDELSFDLSLIDQKSLQLLSNVCAEIPIINMSEEMVESDLVIPERLLSKITDQESKHLEEFGKNFIDSRKIRIRQELINYWYTSFTQLEKIGMLNLTVTVDSAAIFVGPYTVNVHISVLPKLLKLKRYNSQFKILPVKIDIPFAQFLFTDKHFKNEPE